MMTDALGRRSTTLGVQGQVPKSQIQGSKVTAMCQCRGRWFESPQLVLPALFGRARGRVSLRRRVTEDCGPELFVDQNSGLFLRSAGGEGCLEAIIDHLLRRRDGRRLLRSERALPAEHSRLERATVIKGQQVQGADQIREASGGPFPVCGVKDVARPPRCEAGGSWRANARRSTPLRRPPRGPARTRTFSAAP